MADKTDFSARLARIQERERKGSKAEFAPLPDEIQRREFGGKRGGGRGRSVSRSGVKVLLSMAVFAGGLAFYATKSELVDPEHSFAATLIDTGGGMTSYMVEQARTYMSAEDIERMENDPGINGELKRLGLENNPMARLILSN